MTTLAIQIHVDTEIGTRIGVPKLASLLKKLNIPATFYFSLGPDHTGRAIKRIFRPGFFKKVSRTSVVSNYGIRTLLYGVLLPGPHIGKKHENLLREVQHQGFEVGIHAYDHQKWQDGVMRFSQKKITDLFQKARAEFQRIFGCDAKTASSPGWQANEKTLAVYDEANLIYASDTRGNSPFIPKYNGVTYKTLQMPTTLPTLDELLGRTEFTEEKIIDHYLSLLRPDAPNILTIHAELEGMNYYNWFCRLLTSLQSEKIEFKAMKSIAEKLLESPQSIPICEITQSEIDGRSGLLATQRQY